MDRRPLVKGCIANIGIPSIFLLLFLFQYFFKVFICLLFLSQFTVDQPTVNQPTDSTDSTTDSTVDNGGESVAVAVGVSDR